MVSSLAKNISLVKLLNRDMALSRVASISLVKLLSRAIVLGLVTIPSPDQKYLCGDMVLSRDMVLHLVTHLIS